VSDILQVKSTLLLDEYCESRIAQFKECHVDRAIKIFRSRYKSMKNQS
jgi:hypothetical protein